MVLRRPAPARVGPLEAAELPDPEPGRGELVLEVAACAICRTDLQLAEGDLAARRLPIVLGHQAVGRVAAIGPEVEGWRTGDLAGAYWLAGADGVCAFCVSGRENLCERAEFTGWDADGGFADYTVVPEAFAYAIPTVFTDVDAAPLLCAGIIGYRALKLSGVTGHGKLGIYGFGSSAHVTLQVARARGADVYVWTRAPAQQQFARRLGAAWAGDLDAPAPDRMDGAIIFAPVGDVVPVALANLARGGTLALAGIYMTPLPPLPYASLFEERAIRTVTANTRADGAELLEAAAQIPIRPTVTTFPLDQANEALQRLKAGAFAGTGVLV